VSTWANFFSLHAYTDAVAARVGSIAMLSNVRRMCWLFCCGGAVEMGKTPLSLTIHNREDGSRECKQAIEEQGG
jgi:hypothetical protein